MKTIRKEWIQKEKESEKKAKQENQYIYIYIYHFKKWRGITGMGPHTEEIKVILR